MNITVLRDTFTDNSTTSEISIDGEFLCYGLEPRGDRSEGKPYCIAAGTYEVLLQMSARFEMLTPHLQNVPDFTAVEIHVGNYPGDTEGCTLVGQTRGVDFVGSSRIAFEQLMDKLKTADTISATYIGGAP